MTEMDKKQLKILASWLISICDELMRIDANRYEYTVVDDLKLTAKLLSRESEK